MRPVGPALHRVRRAVGHELTDLTAGDLVLVACSGGPDSLTLAAAAAASDRRAGAVIVDHGLQDGSAEVAARAADQCRELGLDPVTVVTTTVIDTGAGPEAAARDARYAALGSAADTLGAAAVLLAHTADDQAETVLLGLTRGSGTRSLSGMPRRRGLFRRPVLDLTRADLAAALAETELAAWQDPHNDDERFTRVRIRRLMPIVEDALGPGVAAALARTAALTRADADALDHWAAREFERLRDGWPVSELADLPSAIRTRVLRRALLEAGAPGQRLTAAHVAGVDRLITDWSGQGPAHLPGRVIARRECGRLVLVSDE
ncbi:MAG: tRNA lysidine(34) synthetase TilS [Candidatus Nanopelagicales bacterium]